MTPPPFAASLPATTQFAKTATPRNDSALLWPENQSQLQGAVLVVIEEIEDLLRGYWRLNESHVSLYAIDV